MTIEIQMPCLSGRLNTKTYLFCRLDFELWNLAGGLALAGGFVMGAEASSADVDFCLLSFYHNRSSVDIRQPASRGMLFGMAYTAPEVSSFTANITLHRNCPVC
jgi:hypothetical protein